MFAVVNILVFSYAIEWLPNWPLRPPRRPHVLPLDVRAYTWDSWYAMLLASDYIRTTPEGLVYQHVLYNEGIKFQYPPPSLLVVDAVRAIVGASRAALALNAMSFAAAVLTSVLVAMIFVESLNSHRRAHDTTRGPSAKYIDGAIAVVLALTFYPLVRAVAVGQIQAWLNAVAAGILWLYLRGFDAPAGVGAALLTLVKPHYGVLLLWSVLRRRWAFATALVATLVLGGAVSLAVYGVQNHLDYLTMVSLMGQGESYYPNQSINGVLNRAVQDVETLKFSRRTFPEFHGLVFTGTLLGLVVVLGIALWPRRWSPSAPVRSIDLSLLLLGVTMTSPIAWEHHYGLLVAIFAASVPALRRIPVFGAATLPLVAASYVLASNFLFGLTVWSSGWMLNLGQSHLFFAALIMLIALVRLRGRLDRADADRTVVRRL